jgi:cell division protein FtsW
MAKTLSNDKILLPTTLALVACGLVMVFSASAVMAASAKGSPYWVLARQLAWAGVGLGAMFAVMRIPHSFYRRDAIAIGALFVTIALLAAVLFMDPRGKTHRWFYWGPFSFQPSELAKVVVVIFLAWFLDDRLASNRNEEEAVNDFRHTLAPVVAVVSLLAGLILGGRDLGTAVMVVLIAAAMLYVAGLRLRYYLAVLVAAVPLFYLFVYRVPYRWKRVEVWLDPFQDALDKGFHMAQSLIAVGSGGITGLGLMQGKQKLFYLPAPETDFIFAVLAEEFGLLGGLALLAGFGLVFWRGLSAALRAGNHFTSLLAVGLTVMVVGQALVNISVAIGLLPAKGIPLPFISYGGSSLLFNLIAAGILLNVTQHVD